jgi:hypothetical protein
LQTNSLAYFGLVNDKVKCFLSLIVPGKHFQIIIDENRFKVLY